MRKNSIALLFVLTISQAIVLLPGFSWAARKRHCIINIPAQRFRVYQGDELILDCRTAVGRLRYPGVHHNTRTRVGRYRISRWVASHVSRDYPTRWSQNPWRGAFGKYAAMLRPRSGYQHVHGTIGPKELGEMYLMRLPPRAKEPSESIREYLRYLDGYEYGLSHGCTRLSNENIERVKDLCPPGTSLRKIYCLHERFITEEPWEIKDLYYPNMYDYEVKADALFFPQSGRLENYDDPPDAIAYH